MATKKVAKQNNTQNLHTIFKQKGFSFTANKAKSDSNLVGWGTNKKGQMALAYSSKGYGTSIYKVGGVPKKQISAMSTSLGAANAKGVHANTFIQGEVKTYGGTIKKVASIDQAFKGTQLQSPNVTNGVSMNKNSFKTIKKKEYSNLGAFSKLSTSQKLFSAKKGELKSSFAKQKAAKVKQATKIAGVAGKGVAALGKAISGGYSKGWSSR